MNCYELVYLLIVVCAILGVSPHVSTIIIIIIIIIITIIIIIITILISMSCKSVKDIHYNLAYIL